MYCRETVAFEWALAKESELISLACWMNAKDDDQHFCSTCLAHFAIQLTLGNLKSLPAAPVSLLWVWGCTEAVTPSHGFLWSVALVIGHNGIRWLLLHWRLQQKEVRRRLLRLAEAVQAYQRSRPRATTRCDAAGSGKSLTSPRFFYFLFLTPSGSTNGSCPSKPSTEFFSVFNPKRLLGCWSKLFSKTLSLWALSMMNYSFKNFQSHFLSRHGREDPTMLDDKLSVKAAKNQKRSQDIRWQSGLQTLFVLTTKEVGLRPWSPGSPLWLFFWPFCNVSSIKKWVKSIQIRSILLCVGTLFSSGFNRVVQER